MSITIPQFANNYLTPNFTIYSDTYTPILPSSAAILHPIGATVILPGPAQQNMPVSFDLNKNPRVHKTVAKFFIYKILDRWIYKSMRELLNFFRINADGVTLIGSMAEYRDDEHTRDTEEITERKIKYMEKYFLTTDIMKKVLKNFVAKSGLNWYDLHREENIPLVKIGVKDKLTKILKETVNERSAKRA